MGGGGRVQGEPVILTVRFVDKNQPVMVEYVKQPNTGWFLHGKESFIELTCRTHSLCSRAYNMAMKRGSYYHFHLF